MPRHIRKGDTVIVTAGNDRGVTGEVLRVIPADDRAVVSGVNVRTKHLKPTQANPQGGSLRREMPVHMSNISPVVDGKATRVRFEVKDDGSKVRIAARTGKVLGDVRGPRVTKKASVKTTTKKTTKKTKAAAE